jgi:hypothetical protein
MCQNACQEWNRLRLRLTNDSHHGLLSAFKGRLSRYVPHCMRSPDRQTPPPAALCVPYLAGNTLAANWPSKLPGGT